MTTLTPMQLVLAGCGLLIYWLVKIEKQRSNKAQVFYLSKFAQAEWFNILFSIVSVVPLLLILPEVIVTVTPNLIAFGAGYLNASGVRNIIIILQNRLKSTY